MKKNLKLFVLAVLGSWMGGSVMAEEHYLVGGATPCGWSSGEDARSAAALMNVSENTWIWCGKLTTGDGDNGAFKIPDTSGGWDGYWAPSEWCPLAPGVAVQLSTDGTGDRKFSPTANGIYKVTINTSEKTILAELLTAPTLIDGYYQIATLQDYYWFAGSVTSGEQSLKARLTADLDFSTDGFFPIGSERTVDDVHLNSFKGEFDGQGHSMTGINLMGTYNKLAPFRSIEGATIKNLKTEGTISTNGYQLGGLVGLSRGGSTIENVVVATALTSSHSGDGTHGGVIAVAHGVPTIKNVAFVGEINAPADYGTCGMIGYAHSGGSIYYTNCFVGGTLTLTGDNNRVFGRNGEHCTNCYTTITDMTKLNDADRFDGGEVNDGQVASGELAYKLNGNSSENVSWYQTIGTDDYPAPFGTAVVYAIGDEYCDGTPKGTLTYTNTEGAANRDDHHWGEWGFCDNSHDGKVCDHIQPGFVTLTDGYYQIGNAKELNWFAVWTDREDATVNAKLTADIDMSGVANFPGIGSDARKFTGTFDGQRHIISNMKMEWEREGVGLVNRAASGAKVMNVTMASSCSFKGSKAVAGLIGGLYGGGDVYIENCGNEAAVVTTGQNAGGVCGVCFNGTILHLTNVYNVGTITGAADRESGSLSGWMANAVIKNCYSIAGYPTASDTHGFQEGNQFARGNDISLTNCYDFGTGSWGKNDGDWGACFKPGAGKIAEVNETEMGRVFAGLYDGEGGNVWRMEYEGWEHPVLYDPAKLVLSENIPNRFTAAENVALTLKRTTVADNWNTFCAPFALDETQIASVFGSGAKVAALTGVEGETMQFSTVSAIEAGKAYLVKPTAAITEKELTVDLVAGAPVADEQGGYAFTGIYEPTLIPQGDLFVAQENKLQPSDGEGKLKGFRAYFKQMGESGARAARFVIDGGETTGVIAVDGTIVENGSAYDLGGRKIANSKAAKGLYIVNGKKMVVK